MDKLSVNSIESNSGVFIGTVIHADGWSSHSKTNAGFGNLSGAELSHCVGIVIDNDVIDTMIDDADQFLIQHAGRPAEGIHAGTGISLADINVNGMATNAALAVGEVEQTGWSSHSKRNAGVGGSKGINIARHGKSYVFDGDVVDAPIKHNNGGSYGQGR